jgi:Ca2+-binding RTX toxin-like protein
MYGGNGNDTMTGGTSVTAYGDDGNDVLDGDESFLYGGNGNDTLTGGFSNLFGGDGDDVLTTYFSSNVTGGNGNDTLNGSDGLELFVFNAPTEGVDTIVNFVRSSIPPEFGDRIVVSASGFGGGLTVGPTGMPLRAITPDQFRLGTAAADASDRFIYNNANGNLFFDPTGSNNGASDQIRFATLVGAPEITSNDIVVDA